MPAAKQRAQNGMRILSTYILPLKRGENRRGREKGGIYR